MICGVINAVEIKKEEKELEHDGEELFKQLL